MRVGILIGYGNDNIAKAQREPFLYYKKELKNRLNLEIKQYTAQTFDEIDLICRTHDSDIIFLLPSWRESLSNELVNKAKNVVKNLKTDYPKRKLVFIDPFAQTSTNYFIVLPYVDYFLKRQCYKDLETYRKNFVGGSSLTDFLAKHWNLDFSQWYVGSELSEDNIHKIMSGWNLGSAKKFKQSLFRKSILGFGKTAKKTIDIFCRLSLGNTNNNEWYTEYRIKAVEALNPLVSDYKVAKSAQDQNNLVSPRQYNSELKKSKIVFSPFGWGENCWRDFEAICHDCLLIKPSMSHIATNPNIFVEDETYVPVQWDFSDLEEKCRYYLEHPEQAEAIIRNAREAYKKYFQQEEFVKIIEKIIK
ncbi:MAG: glycosyltransferase [Crocosphaera sp.]|nr:glycosyltransferase [Crocosphaera sp.]